MERNQVVQTFTEVLGRREITFAEGLNLVADSELDSYDLVSIILELEELLDLSFDDDTQMLFGAGDLSRICDHISELT
jgi:acyl carrier protein